MYCALSPACLPVFGSVSWSGCPSSRLSVCVSAVAVMLFNAAALLNLTTTPTGHCGRFRWPSGTWASGFPDIRLFKCIKRVCDLISWQLQKLDSGFDFRRVASFWNADIFVIRIKPQAKQFWRQFASEGARIYKGRTNSVIPWKGCSNKSCVLVQKKQKQWFF